MLAEVNGNQADAGVYGALKFEDVALLDARTLKVGETDAIDRTVSGPWGEVS